MINFLAALSELSTAIISGAGGLSKLSTECLAILRGEAQLSCFYYLHSLAFIKPTGIEGVSSSFVAKALRSVSADNEEKVDNQVGFKFKYVNGI